MRDFDFGEMVIESIPFLLTIFVVSYITFFIGLFVGLPTVLENDCVVHNSKIYCEVDNKGGEK